MFNISLSFRMLLRDWRGGELSILAVALVIAVTSMTAVGFFTDRVQRGMDQQASELIAGDLVVVSSKPIENSHIEQAEKLGLDTATTVSFRSVVLTNNGPGLVEVKAVSSSYPLRGSLSIADRPFDTGHQVRLVPAREEAWAETRLFQELGLEIGETTTLGSLKVRLDKVLTYEPDRAGDLFSVAPRLMINLSDLDATGLLTQGALVKYHLLIAGEESTVKQFQQWFEINKSPQQSLLTIADGRPELRTALERARHFLGLAALISVVLAGVAVSTAARRFSQRHLDTSAIMRCVGATQRQIIALFTAEMLLLAIMTSTIGCLLGYFSQHFIAQLMGRLLLATLPEPSLLPVTAGYATGILLLLGFAMPPIISLKSVPPLRVLRKDLSGEQVSNWYFYLAVMISISLLLYWQIRDTTLVIYVMLGVAFTLALLAVFASVLIWSLKGIRSRVGVAWRFGLANIVRRPASSVAQVVAFGLGIMVLLLLSTIRNDLLDGWQRSLPQDAPNHFLINIQQDQVKGLSGYFSDAGIETRIYPMVRARMTKKNGIPLVTDDYESERAKHLLTREFNLSWSENLPAASHLIKGEWWQQSDHGKPFLSLEEGIARALQVDMNDVLTFEVNGVEQELRVVNLRKVDWDSFNVNFFTVSPPAILEQYPASWVTSIYLDNKHKILLGDLVRLYPNVTVIDVGVIMTRVRTIMDRVSFAVEFIFIFSLLAGIAILYAAIQASQDERQIESAILRTLGAQKKTLLKGLVAEFVTLGAMAGFLGGICATLLASLLADQVFRFDYSISLTIPFIGVAAGITLVGISGYLGTRRVLDQPPILTLRKVS